MNKELKHIHHILFEVLGSEISNISNDEGTGQYCGCNFQLGSRNIKYRKANITPKKIGQFVALWKRNSAGKTEPYCLDDDVDFYIIEAKQGQNHGLFIFPKRVLAEKQILSLSEKEGKRGFRVYPPWDIPNNKQAINTKSWQVGYFYDLIADNSIS